MLAELGRRNLFFLATEILGFKDVDLKLHWEMASEWEKDARNKLFLCPRGTFKTSICTIAGTIQQIIKNKDIRILISNANLDNAKAILKGIRDHFIHNEKFRALYPDFCPKFKKSANKEFGTMDEFRVPNQRAGIRESTVEVGSVEGNLVSRHYELHIGDDLVNDKNTTTKEQINKVDAFIQAVEALLEPKIGRNYLIGTRWHYDDSYQRILDKADKRSWHIYVRAIKEDDKLIFPARFTEKEVRRLKRLQGATLFSCLYMNDPIPEESQTFKKHWIKYYEQITGDLIHRLDRVTIVDPAIGEKRKSDKTAIVTVGVDCNDDYYVIEAVNKRMTVLEMIQEIFAVFKRHDPRKIGIEAFGFQKSIKYFLEDEMRRKNEYLPIVELSTDVRKSKHARIEGLQPRVQYCNFYISRDMDELENQMLRFPKARYDDILDCLAHSLELVRTPGKLQPKSKNDGMTFASVMQRHVQKGRLLERIGMDRVING